MYAFLYFFFSRCLISFSIAAASDCNGCDMSRSSLWQVCSRSCSRAFIFSDILGICFLAAFSASSLISFLKSCHRIYAFWVLFSGCRFFISECSRCPLMSMYSFSFLLCRRPRGQDHLFFPMKRAFVCASQMETILWLDGIPGTACIQSLRLSSKTSFM